MLNSLGKELSKEDFLVSALGNQHAFVIIQASNTQKPLVVRWPDLLKAILASIPSNPGGQSGVQVLDEGSVIAALAQFINFVGAGVTVTPNGLGVDVTIPGGGGVDIEDEGNPVVTAAAFINFIGAGVTTAPNGLGVDVTIPGGGGGGGLLSGTATQVSSGVYTTTIAGVTSYTAGDAYVIKFTTANDGASTLNINSLGAVNIFKNTNIPIASGDIKANQEIQVVYDGTNFQAIGLVSSQLLAYVHNAEGAVINKGQVVYAYQATGNKMSVKLARADDDSTSAKTIGLVYDTSIGIGGNGYIIIQGVIEGVNTAAFSAGDTLYLSGTTFGGVTNVKPYAPIHLVYVGIVERANAGNGQIYVRCQNGYEMDEIHDVDLVSTPPVNNDVLTYITGPNNLWRPRSVGSLIPSNIKAGSVGVTVDGVTSVIQVGQVGYVEMPYAGSITNWSITGNATGSIVFDVWKASGVIPTVANTMIGLGTKPSLSSQQINLGVPTGWTTVNFLAGDILGFYVDSALTLRRATLTLRTNKS